MWIHCAFFPFFTIYDNAPKYIVQENWILSSVDLLRWINTWPILLKDSSRSDKFHLNSKNAFQIKKKLKFNMSIIYFWRTKNQKLIDDEICWPDDWHKDPFEYVVKFLERLKSLTVTNEQQVSVVPKICYTPLNNFIDFDCMKNYNMHFAWLHPIKTNFKLYAFKRNPAIKEKYITS